MRCRVQVTADQYELLVHWSLHCVHHCPDCILLVDMDDFEAVSPHERALTCLFSFWLKYSLPLRSSIPCSQSTEDAYLCGDFPAASRGGCFFILMELVVFLLSFHMPVRACCTLLVA